MQAQSIIFPTFNEKSMLKEEKRYLRKQVDLKSSLRSGFPKLPVQGVIVHVRLSKGMVMQEKTSVKGTQSLQDNQRQDRAEPNV